MNTRRIVWIALGLIAAGAIGMAVLTGGTTGEDSSARAERLARSVRCPTCQGLSAAESDAKAATAVRAEISRRVAGGESDEQIRQALVDRYGREILLTPEGEGLAALVWALPVGVLVIAGAALAFRLRRVGQATGESPVAPVAGARRLAVGVAIVVAAGGAGIAVARTAGERLPGESATGTVDLGTAELLVQARALLADGRAVEALKLYDRVLEEDPSHPEALAYRGWLVRLAGKSEQGLQLVDTAIAADPDYPDAHLFKGIILLEDLNDADAAIGELRRFLELDPESQFAQQARDSLALAEARAPA